MNLTPMEELLYSTTMVTSVADGFPRHDGTGFFMRFGISGGAEAVMLVTTKSATQDADALSIICSMARGSSPAGLPVPVVVGIVPESIIDHPSPHIDLCAVVVEPTLKQYADHGTPIFMRPLDAKLIPSAKEFKAFDAVEDLIMLSGSRSIFDPRTGRPIVLKGITVTGMATDYRHRPEFLADIATFPGSCGAPVFLSNRHGYFDPRRQKFVAEPRLKLVGVLTGGAYVTVDNELIVGDPLQYQEDAMLDFGSVLRATALLELGKAVYQQRTRKTTRTVGARKEPEPTRH
ncbi:hypothetical protein HJA76_30660 [Rhizobium bangladeshense]|uniref:hypothetical protein n=1 Tax=Rhizobium bangladeshense TaxID=1138189 RepID=UPI001C83F238|nr:hypothetical protein [Rhizobium bangladeshense]MBX4923977.1 hypothetical protein [Rhizobium bangladeshense]